MRRFIYRLNHTCHYLENCLPRVPEIRGRKLYSLKEIRVFLLPGHRVQLLLHVRHCSYIIITLYSQYCMCVVLVTGGTFPIRPSASVIHGTCYFNDTYSPVKGRVDIRQDMQMVKCGFV